MLGSNAILSLLTPVDRRDSSSGFHTMMQQWQIGNAAHVDQLRSLIRLKHVGKSIGNVLHINKPNDGKFSRYWKKLILNNIKVLP